MTSATESEGILFSAGSILLDIYAEVDTDFLQKWNLQENEATICGESRLPIFDEVVDRYEVSYIPGGATLNAVRVCQWMLNKPNACGFFGIIGNDNYGKILIEKTKEEGVNVHFEVNKSVKTGTCAVLITGVNRSLCSHSMAGRLLNAGHLKMPHIQQMIEKATYFYIPAFVVVASAETALEIAKHSAQQGKTFVSNISATYIPQKYTYSFLELLPFVDILFGNSDEAFTLARVIGFQSENIEEIALTISEIKKNAGVPRIVIITQGAEPTIVANNGQVKEFPVAEIPREKIIDTNGAGDAFVGGFLSQFMVGKSMEDSMLAAGYAAGEIIQQKGCSFPEKCKFHNEE